MRIAAGVLAPSLLLVVAIACTTKPGGVDTNPAAALAQQAPRQSFQDKIERNAKEMLEEGKKIFRFDTFGSEDFWGGKLKLHQAIAGEKLRGKGPGLSPEQALKLGLKVDVDAIPNDVAEALNKGKVDL